MPGDDGAADDGPNDDGAADESSERHIAIERLDPLSLDEALSIVGESTRARILLELGEARTGDPGEVNRLGFSELMDRVGVEDSGRFNYHLNELVGSFVAKDEEGYQLRLPGQRLYQAIVAGTLTDRRTVEPFRVGDCPDCDGRLTAAYHPDHLLTVECTACETLFDAAHFPARGVEGRSKVELLDAAYRRRHHEAGAMRRGVCPACAGRVERTLRRAAADDEPDPLAEAGGLETYAVMACVECSGSLVGHPTNVALTCPVVVGFLAEHGLDAALARWWEDPVAAARHDTAVVAAEPLAVAITFEVAGDRLRVVLDDDLQVAESERSGE